MLAKRQLSRWAWHMRKPRKQAPRAVSSISELDRLDSASARSRRARACLPDHVTSLTTRVRVAYVSLLSPSPPPVLLPFNRFLVYSHPSSLLLCLEMWLPKTHGLPILRQPTSQARATTNVVIPRRARRALPPRESGPCLKPSLFWVRILDSSDTLLYVPFFFFSS